MDDTADRNCNLCVKLQRLGDGRHVTCIWIMCTPQSPEVAQRCSGYRARKADQENMNKSAADEKSACN